MRHIRIHSKGILAVPGQVEITDSETGAEIPGVRSASITMGVGDLIKAEVELYSQVDVVASGTFFVIHPDTRNRAAVKRIEFLDGRVWEL